MIPWFLTLAVVWKVWHGETFTSLSCINLQEGKREVDIEEENWYIRNAARQPQPWWRRVLDVFLTPGYTRPLPFRRVCTM